VFSDFVFFGGAALGVVVGAVYFREAPRKAPLAQRLAASAYGPAIAALYLAVAFAWPRGQLSSATAIYVYYALQGVPLLLAVYSLAAYPGPKRLHIALVPLAAIAWLWTFALGYWGVHGK
jgi:hypothetical protein